MDIALSSAAFSELRAKLEQSGSVENNLGGIISVPGQIRIFEITYVTPDATDPLYVEEQVRGMFQEILNATRQVPHRMSKVSFLQSLAMVLRQHLAMMETAIMVIRMFEPPAADPRSN